LDLEIILLINREIQLQK